MQQYVDRVDAFLEALLFREAMPGGPKSCRHCGNAVAIWRCRDCVLATPRCRSCMRQYHKENPFHRIERWNGSYYQKAELREVGTYLLIRHHRDDEICETLQRWCHILDSAEVLNDKAEQDELVRYQSRPAPGPVPASDTWANDEDIDMDEINMDDLIDENAEDLYDEEDEEMPGSADPALASSTIGSLHRVVHNNGVHNIAMVSCECHGENNLPLDLFAAQLIPASLKRIKTLFTAQVLDNFRLSNLELKASAYQYYQLLRRLTKPMAPAEVLDLYREFRRMTRIWRWMKKLKWAGYAGSTKSVKEVESGELAIFCPACPQPGINLPDNWRDDKARQVEQFFILSNFLKIGNT